MPYYIHVLMKKTIIANNTAYIVPAKTREELSQKGYVDTDKIQISPGYYTGSENRGIMSWNEEKHYQIWKKV